MDTFNIVIHAITLVMLGYLYFKLFKTKNFLNILKYKLKTMNIDIDDIIDNILLDEPQIDSKTKQVNAVGPNKLVDQPTIAIYRQRLAECISAGNSKTYLGKHLSLEQLGIMSEKEVVKCYAIYESKLGLNMTKSLGHSILSLYTAAVSHLFPIDSKEKLTEDLKNDPLITESLSSITSHLYFRYGSILAPLAATMITYGHIKKLPNEKNNVHSNIITEHGRPSGTEHNTDCNYSGTYTNYSGTDSNESNQDATRGNQEATIDDF